MQEMEDCVNNLKRIITVNKKEILFVCIGTNEIIWDSAIGIIMIRGENPNAPKNIQGENPG